MIIECQSKCIVMLCSLLEEGEVILSLYNAIPQYKTTGNHDRQHIAFSTCNGYWVQNNAIVYEHVRTNIAI